MGYQGKNYECQRTHLFLLWPTSVQGVVLSNRLPSALMRMHVFIAKHTFLSSALAASETAHNRGKRFHTRIGYDEVGEPEALASSKQILDDLIARADKDGWDVQNV